MKIYFTAITIFKYKREPEISGQKYRGILIYEQLLYMFQDLRPLDKG